MEYLAGSFVTLAVLFLSAWIFRRSIPPAPIRPYASQARSFYQIAPFIAYIIGSIQEPSTNTQSHKHSLKTNNSIKVVFFENEAYWIQDNIFYTAHAPNNMVDHSSTKVVDTMTMDKVQLEKISMIVEKLTEGNSDDSGNSRHKKLY